MPNIKIHGLLIGRDDEQIEDLKDRIWHATREHPSALDAVITVANDEVTNATGESQPYLEIQSTYDPRIGDLIEMIRVNLSGMEIEIPPYLAAFIAVEVNEEDAKEG